MGDNSIALSRLTEEIRNLKREIRISNIMNLAKIGMITRDDLLGNNDLKNYVSSIKTDEATNEGTKNGSNAIRADVRSRM